MVRVQHGVQEEQHDVQVQHVRRVQHDVPEQHVQHEELAQHGVQEQHGVLAQRGVQALREAQVKASLVLAWGQQQALLDVGWVLQQGEELPSGVQRPFRDERLLLRDEQRLPHAWQWAILVVRGP